MLIDRFGASSRTVLSAVLLVVVASAPSAAAATVATECPDMAKLSLPDTTITSATLVTGASPVPEYCRVLVVLEGKIHFEDAITTTR